MERVHYFHGQLLTADDFQAEQDYFLGQHRRLNLRTHGPGVVSGLRVSIDDGVVHVRPGVAIDPRGNEIVLDEPRILPVPADEVSACVTLAYSETLVRPLPASSGPEFTRIADGFVLRCAPCDEVDSNSVVLARLRSIAGRWHADRPANGFTTALCASAVLLAVCWLFRKPRP